MGGFDDRLPLGYEGRRDLLESVGAPMEDLVYVSKLRFCWASRRQFGELGGKAGAFLLSEGYLRGVCCLRQKLLPIRYALRTWLISTAGLAKDHKPTEMESLRRNRIAVLFHMAGRVCAIAPRKEGERCSENANISPKETARFPCLRLTDDDVRANRCD